MDLPDEIRTFICMEINDPEIIKNASEVQAAFESEGKDIGKLKFVELHNIHITLKFLGNITMETAQTIYGILQQVNAEIIPEGGFDIELKTVGEFGKRVLWVGVEDPAGIIENVQARIEDELFSLGIPREKRPFEGHMTLARVKFLKDKKLFGDKVRSVKDTRFGTQHVAEVLLKRSQLTPRGPIYTTLRF
jgi:2'-5' RNA ligase